MGLRDWLSNSSTENSGNSNNTDSSDKDMNTNQSLTGDTPRRLANNPDDGEFPWLNYPDRGWKVPCPACDKNVSNDFSAFKSHWQDSSKCPGPRAVDDATWTKLGVNPSTIQEDVDHGAGRSSSGTLDEVNSQNYPEMFPDSSEFPFFGTNRDRMRVECPGCTQRIDNTQASFISHWRNSNKCDGPPDSRVPGVDLDSSQWDELVRNIRKNNSTSISDHSEPDRQTPSQTNVEQDNTAVNRPDEPSRENSPPHNNPEDTPTEQESSVSEQTEETKSEAKIGTGDEHKTSCGESNKDSSQSQNTDGDRNIPDTIPSVSLDQTLSHTDFEKKEQIGRGGNADVFRATVSTDQPTSEMALKEPRMGGTLHKDAIERMLNEAETWHKLDEHDHIVDVIDYGADPLPWIAMEYMDGGDLGERLGSMDFEQALWTAIRITTAVRHAHRRGVAHLDLKPQNILFRTVDGKWDVPKVADWGLSKHLLNHSQTIDGMSPRHAAPEQFNEDIGKKDDITDVYQLGAVFYELFTGRPPFDGTPTEIMYSTVSDEPSPPSNIADLPDALDDILLKALAKNKNERYESVLYFRDDLKDLM